MCEHGDVFHVACRSQALRLRAIDGINRARTATARAAGWLDEAIERRTRRSVVRTKTPTLGTCPLCRQSAAVIDWRPGLDWLTVSGCPCGTFFVHAGLLDERLAAISPEVRETLCRSIQDFRAMKQEAWLTTTTGAPEGTLVVRTTRK